MRQYSRLGFLAVTTICSAVEMVQEPQNGGHLSFLRIPGLLKLRRQACTLLESTTKVNAGSGVAIDKPILKINLSLKRHYLKVKKGTLHATDLNGLKTMEKRL